MKQWTQFSLDAGRELSKKVSCWAVSLCLHQLGRSNGEAHSDSGEGTQLASKAVTLWGNGYSTLASGPGGQSPWAFRGSTFPSDTKQLLPKKVQGHHWHPNCQSPPPQQNREVSPQDVCVGGRGGKGCRIHCFQKLSFMLRHGFLPSPTPLSRRPPLWKMGSLCMGGNIFPAKSYLDIYNVICRPYKIINIKIVRLQICWISSSTCSCLGRDRPNDFTGLVQPGALCGLGVCRSADL